MPSLVNENIRRHRLPKRTRLERRFDFCSFSNDIVEFLSTTTTTTGTQKVELTENKKVEGKAEEICVLFLFKSVFFVKWLLPSLLLLLLSTYIHDDDDNVHHVFKLKEINNIRIHLSMSIEAIINNKLISGE